MYNHYHLLIETPEGNIAQGMRQLNGIYTQRFNKRNQKVGHLFQGRYKSILVDKESYLLELSRYIALNPVRGGIVNDPKDWYWSAYCQRIGLHKGISCLFSDWILSQLNPERNKAITTYQEFVLSGIDEESPLKKVKGQLILGSEHFIQKIGYLIKKQEELEIPKKQRYVTRPPLSDIFDYKEKKQQEKQMYQACQQYGYTLKEIAEYLGVHYTTVSKVIKRVENE